MVVPEENPNLGDPVSIYGTKNAAANNSPISRFPRIESKKLRPPGGVLIRETGYGWCLGTPQLT